MIIMVGIVVHGLFDFGGYTDIQEILLATIHRRHDICTVVGHRLTNTYSQDKVKCPECLRIEVRGNVEKSS